MDLSYETIGTDTLFWNLKKNLIRIKPEIEKQKKTSVWVYKTRTIPGLKKADFSSILTVQLSLEFVHCAQW